MKKYKLLLIFCFGFVTTIYAQVGEQTKWAFERTAYKRWNKFRPWTYFLFTDYDDGDKRTMYARAKQMTEWSLYKDHYDVLDIQVDSSFTAEQVKAVDRTINKSWLLLQKPVVEAITKKIDEALVISTERVESAALLIAINFVYNSFLQKIQLTLESYTSDSKKEAKVAKYIDQLNSLYLLISFVNDAEILKYNDLEEIDYDTVFEYMDERYSEIFPETLREN